MNVFFVFPFDRWYRCTLAVRFGRLPCCGSATYGQWLGVLGYVAALIVHVILSAAAHTVAGRDPVFLVGPLAAVHVVRTPQPGCIGDDHARAPRRPICHVGGCVVMPACATGIFPLTYHPPVLLVALLWY